METQVHRGGARSGGAPAGPAARLPARAVRGRSARTRRSPPHAWRRRRPADLLKLVALAPGPDALARAGRSTTLWPDKDRRAARTTSTARSTTCARSSAAAGSTSSAGRSRSEGDVWVDVDAFEAAAARRATARAATQAVALYRGDLAPEDRDAAWLAARAAPLLRGRFVEAALPLARAAAAGGGRAGRGPAPAAARRGATPTTEEAHRLLVRRPRGERAPRRGAPPARRLRARAPRRRARGRPRSCARCAPPSSAARSARPSARPPLDGARRAARRLLGDDRPAAGAGPRPAAAPPRGARRAGLGRGRAARRARRREDAARRRGRAPRAGARRGGAVRHRRHPAGRPVRPVRGRASGRRRARTPPSPTRSPRRCPAGVGGEAVRRAIFDGRRGRSCVRRGRPPGLPPARRPPRSRTSPR